MRNELLKALQGFGLNWTEARVYLALLANNPANGNQISRASGVPSAKVYETLNRLRELGMVAPRAGNTFVPLPLDEFLRQREAWLREAGELLRKYAPQPLQRYGEEVLWHGKGYRMLLEKAREMLRSAQDEVLLSAWPSEFGFLKADLVEAAERGVHVSAIVFGTEEEIFGLVRGWSPKHMDKLHLFPHVLLPSVFTRHKMQAALALDDVAAFLMTGLSSDEWVGVWTGNRAVVTVVANYIRHDIYANKMYADFGKQLHRRYGQALEDLLDVRKGSFTQKLMMQCLVTGEEGI